MRLPVSLRFTLCCVVIITAFPAMGSAGDMLVVKLTTGRQFSGIVDARTDPKKLWLRCGREGITVVRPIAWDQVASAVYQNQIVLKGELRKLAHKIKSKNGPAPLTTGRANSGLPLDINASSGLSYAQRARHALGTAAPVQTVQFDAFPENWDADPETDGLVVRVCPRSGADKVARINGTVHVEFFALAGNTPTRIGNWSRRVSADQFAEAGLELRLPFQAVHAEFSGTDRNGLIHVRFAAPGHGVFEHSQEAIREQADPDAFLATELRGRSLYIDENVR